MLLETKVGNEELTIQNDNGYLPTDRIYVRFSDIRRS